MMIMVWLVLEQLRPLIQEYSKQGVYHIDRSRRQLLFTPFSILILVSMNVVELLFLNDYISLIRHSEKLSTFPLSFTQHMATIMSIGRDFIILKQVIYYELIKQYMLQICVLLALIVGCNAQITVDVVPLSTTASATTSHEIHVYYTSGTITTGSKIFIQYQTDWDINSVTGGGANDFCQTGCTLGSIGLTRTGNQITLNGFFPSDISSSFNVLYTLNNIVNPPYQISSNIIVGIADSTDIPIDLNFDSVTIQPTPLTCSLTPSVLTVSSVSNYQIQINPTITLPPTIYILLNFPTSWHNSATSGTFAAGTVTCSSVSSPTIACLQLSTRIVRASTVVTGTTTTPFSFTINNINNPGSVQENSQLQLLIYNDSKAMASCFPEIRGLQARSLLNFNIAISGNVGDTVAPTLTFEVDEQPAGTDWMEIYFPSEYEISKFTNGFININNQTVVIPVEAGIQNSTLSHRGRIFPFVTDALARYTVSLYQIRLPTSQKQASNITVQTFRHGHLIAEGTCCSFTPSAISSSLINLTLSDYQIGEMANYQFTVTLSVNSYEFLLIQFDSAYTLSPITCQTDDSLTSPTCSIQSASSYRVSNLPRQLTSLTIKLNQISNPSTISQLNFIVKTIDTGDYLIETLTTQYQLVGSSIVNVVVTPADTTTMAITSYQFRIQNSNQLPTNLQVRITFPSSVLVQNSAKCFVNGTQYGCSISGGVVIPLNNVATIGAGQLSTSNITVTDVKNPPSLQATQSFRVELFSNSISVQSMTKTITTSMSTVPTFTTLSITPSNTITYTASSYSIGIQLPIIINDIYPGLYSSMEVFVSVPSQYELIQCTGCSSYSTFSLPLNSNSIHTLTMDIRNPHTTTTSSSFRVDVLLDGYLSISQGYSLLTAWQPHDIQYSLSSQNTFLKEPATIEVNISQPIPQQVDEVKVTIPTQFTITTLSAHSNSQGTLTITGKQVSVSSIPQLQGIVVTIHGLINPSANVTNSWVVQFLRGNVLVAQSTGSIGFTTECTMPCRSCVGVACSSCYMDSAITTLNYLSGSSCVSGCSSSQYEVNFTCYDCSSDCASCALVDYNCSSCANGSYLYNSVCVSDCPPLFYADSLTNECKQCVSPCSLCSNTTCLYCDSGYVLTHLSACELSCPTGYYNHSNVCEQCGVNCSDCTIAQCLTCINSTYLYNGSCEIQCPLTLYISADGLRCQSCQSPCLSCAVSSSQCAACDQTSSNKYLDNNMCLTVCPSTKYPDENNICQSCLSPCNECLNDVQCLNCIGGYNYYSAAHLCYVSCPTNTILVSNQCFECTSPCLECTSSPTNCVSCIEGYFLDGSTCNATCTLPYFAIDRQCRLCGSPCATCSNLQPYVCTTCQTGYFLLQTSCYTSCPDGTFANGLICQVCTSGCLTCSGTSSTCLSCYPGLYLFLTNCIPTCPTSPVLYYQYQSQCIECQPQCQSCLSTPVECAACTLSTDYLNLATRECVNSCSNPYFPSTTTGGERVCIECSDPCKTCTTSNTLCDSCFNGKYLYLSTCIDQCPSAFYEDHDTNKCERCSNECISCDGGSTCLVCSAISYIYQGSCYLTCPAQAPFTYKTFCRNCLKDNCLLCNDNNECVLCQTNYYNYQSQCYESCPTNYEPDSVTNTRCIQTDEFALLSYLLEQEKYKAFVLPASIIFIFLLPFLYFKAKSKVLLLYGIIAFPQTLSYFILTVMTALYANIFNSLIPQFVMYVLGGLFLLLNVVHFCMMQYALRKDQIFQRWVAYGKNQERFTILAMLSFLNKKILYIILSGFLKMPFTSCQINYKTLHSIKKFYILHALGLFFIQLPYIGFSIYLIVVEKYNLNNYKLLFALIDASILSLVSIIVSIVFMVKDYEIPRPYKKNIIEGISNLSLAAFSQEPNEFSDDDDDRLHRSNSVELYKESEQMKEVEFKSVFDPEEYEDPPVIENKKIQSAIKRGTFRKSNMKKRKKGKKLNDLEVISEESSEDEDPKKKKRKRKRMRKNKVGYLNNYIYWKPGEKKQKEKPEQVFRVHQKEIMKKIKQKQSQFDTITQNDIIFMEQSLHSSDSSDFYEEESKRELNAQYDAFLNRNYAKKKHLQ